MTDHAADIARQALARSTGRNQSPGAAARAGTSGAPQPVARGPIRERRGVVQRLPGLDLLRVFAVLAVIAFHLLFRGPISGWTSVEFPALSDTAAYGYAGVDLFFVISGFVIAWSSEGRGAAAFARARFLRLWPAFVVCMTVTAVILALAQDPHFPVSAAQWVANLVFLPQALGQGFVDGAYWSIVAELTFYGWVFLAMALGLWPRRVLEIGAVWLAISLANLAIGSALLERVMLTPFAGEFMGGVLIYRMRREGSRPALVGMLAASVMVAVIQSVPFAAGLERLYGYRADPVAVALIHVAIFGLVAAAASVRLSPRLAGVAVVAGGTTYPAYLLHQNVGYVLIDRLVPAGLPAEAAALLIVALVFGAAWAVWRWVEPAGRRLLGPVLDLLIARLPEALRVPPRVADRRAA
jgi:peptidoglycan/LPS O-acetylase OafA/YrhL